MGGDRPPAELAVGVVRAAADLPVHLIVAAPRSLLPPLPQEVDVLECSPAETGKGAVSRVLGEGTSIVRGLEALRRQEADAFLSPGSTGAVVATALLRLGRLPGILRPGLCVSLPTLKGEALLIDGGATVDPKPAYLPQFAALGMAYAREVLGIANPTFGLLNNGTEQGKGDRLTREVYTLLSDRPGFVGNVEPHQILADRPADVVVTGGFSGNLVLKALEGGGEAVLLASQTALRSSARARLGGLLARPALRAVGKMLRYEEYNAAPLLGVRGLVAVAHGRSDAQAMAGAVRRLYRACEARIVERIGSALVRAPA